MGALERLRASAAPLVGQRMPLAGLGVYRSDGPAEGVGLVTGPTLTLVLQGGKTATLGDRVFDYSAGQYLVVTVDLPMSSRVAAATPREPFLAIGLRLRPALVGELLADDRTRPRAVSVAAAGVSPADEPLLEAFERLVRMRTGTAEAIALAPGIEREIHWRLLTGPQDAAMRALGTAGGQLEGVARAIEWIRTHSDEVLRVDDVARAARVSVPTLNRHFKAVTALTPLGYQKMLRLHDARLRLLSSPNGVGAAGYSVGYDNRSQFSREYKRMFGASPSRDVAAIREQGRTVGGQSSRPRDESRKPVHAADRRPGT